jgi:hypothetical protein
MVRDRIHLPVTRKIKHQMLLIYINAAWKSSYPLIVTPILTTRGVFRQGIKEDMEFKVHISRSGQIDIKFVIIIDVMCLFLQSKVIGQYRLVYKYMRSLSRWVLELAF